MRVKMLRKKDTIGRDKYRQGDVFEMDNRVAPAFITAGIVVQVSDNAKIYSGELEEKKVAKKEEDDRVAAAKKDQEDKDLAEKRSLADKAAADKAEKAKAKNVKQSTDSDPSKDDSGSSSK